MPAMRDANLRALNAGHAFGETAEMPSHVAGYSVAAAELPAGAYRTVSGTEALAWGLLVGLKASGLSRLVLGSYPITPASPLLHTLAGFKEYGVVTFQAEDEIAAICAAIGASYAGALGVTSSSGPGIALKGEAIGLMGRVADRSGLFSSASKSLRLYFQSAMLALGAWLAIEQQITAGMIIAATIIMSRALAPSEQAIGQWRAFVGARQALRRVRSAVAQMPNDDARMRLPEPSGVLSAERLYAPALDSADLILKGIDFLRGAAEIVWAHHERYDGTGYPRGLAGEEIPLGARVFGVVDAYDAMTSRRPYRESMSREQAAIEIARNSGSQFDPTVVDAFLRLVEQGAIPTDE